MRPASSFWERYSGADPGFFLGGGALVSCSTSTPINHLVFFFFFSQNTSCIRKRQVISGVGVRTPYTLPLDPHLLLGTRQSVMDQFVFPGLSWEQSQKTLRKFTRLSLLLVSKVTS